MPELLPNKHARMHAHIVQVLTPTQAAVLNVLCATKHLGTTHIHAAGTLNMEPLLCCNAVATVRSTM